MNQEAPTPNNSNDTSQPKQEVNKVYPKAEDKKLYGDRDIANFSERSNTKE